MQIKLFDALHKLLSGLKASTPDIEVIAALTKFCKTYGSDVVVEKHGHHFGQENEKRHFLILFESETEASQFAYEAVLSTYGHEGVIVEVA